MLLIADKFLQFNLFCLTVTVHSQFKFWDCSYDFFFFAPIEMAMC